MLLLISTGLCDEKDMSLRAVEAARSCDVLYLEGYTTRLGAGPDEFSELLGKQVIPLTRHGMEDGSGSLLKEASAKDVGILVGGDALSATTHHSLLQEAREAGVRAEVIHGSSIFTAIAESGLFLYRFGPATTLCYPEKGYSPTSCYDTISRNMSMGFHTLVLLDIKSKEGRYMSVPEGIGLLLESGTLGQDKELVACHFGERKRMAYGKASELMNMDMETPSVILVPGKLNFMENEILLSLKG